MDDIVGVIIWVICAVIFIIIFVYACRKSGKCNFECCEVSSSSSSSSSSKSHKNTPYAPQVVQNDQPGYDYYQPPNVSQPYYDQNINYEQAYIPQYTPYEGVQDDLPGPMQ
ncbi:hypothetical protein GPJ56_001013 [Histomonas meleagridis]|uniref:uncharacterized protein n=1 Tax=Histomonas meleagridis TaxID=135588 RepID=UPI00355AC096|nr:hypothetical protein GPJ56_001013 [Histomonas meleagridis]KAH0804674.1 hypothetical protein GO595_002539 [Histomonas meleagridis]